MRTAPGPSARTARTTAAPVSRTAYMVCGTWTWARATVASTPHVGRRLLYLDPVPSADHQHQAAHGTVAPETERSRRLAPRLSPLGHLRALSTRALVRLSPDFTVPLRQKRCPCTCRSALDHSPGTAQCCPCSGLPPSNSSPVLSPAQTSNLHGGAAVAYLSNPACANLRRAAGHAAKESDVSRAPGEGMDAGQGCAWLGDS